MKKTIFTLIAISIFCSCNSQRIEKDIFNNASFKKEIKIYTDYLNGIDSEGINKFIHILQYKPGEYSFITISMYEYEDFQGYLNYNGRYLIFDDRINNEILNEWISVKLKDISTINCEGCQKVDELQGYLDPLEETSYTFKNNNFQIISGCIGVDFMKFFNLRSEYK